jgi:starch-binding outer membrane protein, SusD/RagB family
MKTMKNIKILLSIICVIFVFVSCQKDFIDLEPKNKLTTDVALSTLDGLEGSILGVYERGRFVYTSNDYSLYKCCNTDIIMPGSHLTDQIIFNEYVRLTGFDAENTAVEAVWNGYYTGISRCNIIIDGIDLVNIDESKDDQVQRKNIVLGEAYYFRAYFHYELIQRWDNIVLADHVFDDPSQKTELASSEDVYNLIIKDLETAIPLLPEASNVTSRGKVSKGVARHLLSKAYMEEERWSDAAEMAVSVIEDPAYNDLTANEVPIEDIFSCEHQENKEIIFSWQFSQNDLDNPQRTSTQFFPLYDRISGVRRSFYQGARPWSRLHPTPYYWTLFDDNDLRLDAWHIRYWVYDFEGEDPVNGLDNVLPAGVELGDTVTPENADGTSGFDINILIVPTTTKYLEDSTLGMNLADAEGFRNIIQFRVSEAYLIAAEAYLRAGEVSTGQPYLDAVRARAGVDPIDLTLDNIIDEQARELGHEGHRYGFLKRQGILYERIQEHSTEIGEVMQPFHVSWPIPKSFVDLTKVKQNEGYE